jgi:hypothetical protein
MPGYLDQYGAGEERRLKIIKVTALELVSVLIFGGLAWWFLNDYKEERRARQFFTFLAHRDYQAAYALWGCTDAHPCRDYPLNDFMKDWGPASGRGDPETFRVTKSRSCGSGVILTVEAGNQQEKLWVERSNLVLGFSPLPGCPPPR